MTSPPFFFLLAICSLLLAALPDRRDASCEKTEYIEIRSDRCRGCFECRPAVPPSAREPRGHEQDAHYGPEYDAVSAGRLQCRDNEQPMIVDERSVRCEVRR